MFYQFPPDVAVNISTIEMGHCPSGWRQVPPRTQGDTDAYARELSVSGSGLTILIQNGKLFAVIAGDPENRRWICEDKLP